MANVPLAPAPLGQFTGSTAAAISYGKTAVIKNLAAVVIDFSTWNSIDATLVGPGSTNHNYNSSVTVTGNADGTLSLAFDPSALPDIGSYKLIVMGSPAGGDPAELIGLGTFNLAA